MDRWPHTPAWNISNVTNRSAEGLGEVFRAVDRLPMIVTHLMFCYGELCHTIRTLPLPRDVRWAEAVKDKVAIGARLVDLTDEIVSIDCSRSGSSEAPVVVLVGEEAASRKVPTRVYLPCILVILKTSLPVVVESD